MLSLVFLLLLPIQAQDSSSTSNASAATAAALASIPGAVPDIASRIRAHIDYLASDVLGGRATGSTGGKAAAEYARAQLAAMGLEPRLQEIGKGPGVNILAEIPGATDEWIILGAHYDHLGTIFGQVYNGADDNASGVAALLEAARLLVGGSRRYGILIAAFDAEERGLVGSGWLAAHVGKKVSLMLSIDMVGHLRDEGRLIYDGVGMLRDGESLVRAAGVAGLSVACVSAVRENVVLSDNYSFAARGVPAFMLTTGLATSPYHLPTDDASTIDTEGVALVARQVAAFVSGMDEELVATGAGYFEAARFRLKPYASSVMTSISGPGYGSGALERGSGLGLDAFVPLGKAYVTDLFLELGLAYEDARTIGTGFELSSSALLAQAGASLSVNVVGALLREGLGVYGRASWAQGGGELAAQLADPARREIGLRIVCDLEVANGMRMIEGFGMGFEARFGLRALYFENPSAADLARSFVFRLSWTF
jgi:hypothetical protein